LYSPPAALETLSSQRFKFFPLALKGRQRKIPQQLRCIHVNDHLAKLSSTNPHYPKIGFFEDFSFPASQRKAKKRKTRRTLRLCGERMIIGRAANN
jgi:hypothetical protein